MASMAKNTNFELLFILSLDFFSYQKNIEKGKFARRKDAYYYFLPTATRKDTVYSENKIITMS